MDSDHWRKRVKGSILRREFLGYVFKATKWAAGIAVSVGAGEFLAARRERPMTRIVSARGTASGRANVMGVGESTTGRLQYRWA
jgi:hypothetical protein